MPGRTEVAADAVRFAHGLVEGAGVVLRLADEDGAGDVGVVAVVGGAEIEEKRVAALHAVAAGMTVRLGGLRAAEHDRREGHLLRTGGVEVAEQLGLDLALGDADPDLLQRLLQCRLGHRDRLAHGADFVAVLAEADRRDGLVRIDDGDAGDGLDQRHLLEDAHALAFDAETLHAQARDRGGGGAVIALAVLPRKDLRREAELLPRHHFEGRAARRGVRRRR